MKILLVNNFHYLRGGADKVYLETGKLLERNGHDVFYFSSLDPRNEETVSDRFFVKGMDLFQPVGSLAKAKNGLRYLYSFEAKSKLSLLISEIKPDVIHLHIFQSRLTAAILPVLRKYKIPVLMTLHEYKMLCPVYSLVDSSGRVCEMCPKKGLHHSLVKRCTRNSLAYSTLAFIESKWRETFLPYEQYVDRFLGVSNFIVNKHLEYRPWMQKKIFCLYNFIQMRKFSAVKKKENYYLYVGRLSEAKGLMVLLEAWQNVDLPLLIIGSGELQERMQQYIQENNLTQVVMLGYLTEEELIPYIQKAQYLIMPSVTYETFGLTLLEAMACGTPALASASGGMPELIQHGVNGYLFESNNSRALLNVVDFTRRLSEEDYNRLVTNAMNFVQRFDEHQYYQELMSHYFEVIQNKGISKNN